MSRQDVRIVHASLEVFDSSKEARHDIGKLGELGAEILCGTESGDDARHNLIQHTLEYHGYRVFTPANTDCWIAVRSDFLGSGWNSRYHRIFGGSHQMGRRGPFGEKGTVSVGFDVPGLGHIGVVVAHYLTQNAAWDADALNKKLAYACVDENLRHSAGLGISFFTADTNLVDKVRDVFYGDEHLTTCWDELKKWPDTGHGNIDVVASVDADKRVKCKSARVLTDSDLKLFTDHFVVDTVYSIKKI